MAEQKHAQITHLMRVLKVEQSVKVEEQVVIRHDSEGEKSYRLVSQGRKKIFQGTKGSSEGKKRKL